MFKIVLFIITIGLSACAQFPKLETLNGEIEDPKTVSSWLLPVINATESAQLLMCDVATKRETCKRENSGLDAAGLGGIFLPLKVSVPTVTLRANRVDIHVVINGVDATCTSGSVITNVNRASVEFRQVYCNWLLVGNVISNLELSIDWDDPINRTFGGRYIIRFFGTGNGSGSGIYSAEVQS